MIQFTLYSRSYCHLCEDMLHTLQEFSPEFNFAVDVLDVDADPALVALYDELVPVLLAGKQGQATHEVCHYHLDREKTRALLVADAAAGLGEGTEPATDAGTDIRAGTA